MKEKIHTHKYMMSKNLFGCLSVTNLDLNYHWTGRIEWSEPFIEGLCQKDKYQICFLGKGPVGLAPRAK